MFKKLKGLFIVDEEGKANVGKTPSNKSVSKSSNQGTTSANKKPSAQKPNERYEPSSDAKPNEKFVNLLLGAIEKNNIDGFDYLEYKQALQNLSNVQMDEATRYKSAMAMAKTMGATPAKLESSAGHYVKILQKEEKKFLEAFQNQQNAKVSARNNEIKSLEKSIVDKTKMIEQLKVEIEKEKTGLEAKKTAINNAAAKVASTKDSFYLAYNIVVDQIKQDLANIKKYLS